MLQKLPATQFIILSFFTVISLGFLALLISENTSHFTWLDLLFTSVSATCVTGLLTLNMQEFTFWGQVIVLFLIQVGGISVVVFFRLIWFGRSSSKTVFSNRMMGDMVDVHGDRKTVLYFLMSTFRMTLAFELIGMILLYFTLSDSLEFFDKLWISVFLAISAFNNAGITILNESEMLSTVSNGSISILSLLIIMGGIGYPVLVGLERIGFSIIEKILYKLTIYAETWVLRNPSLETPVTLIYTSAEFIRIRLDDTLEEIKGHASMVQIKTTIAWSIFLILTGMVLFYLLQPIEGQSTKDVWLHSYFMSVTSRTAGFSFLNVTTFSAVSLLLLTILMFIGASPQGTGGGLKTTTFALMLAYLKSSFKGENRVKLFGEVISRSSIGNAVKLYLLSTTMIVILSFALLISSGWQSYLPVLFETVSAFATVGLSSGLTSESLNSLSKWILIFAMFVGRVNILTIGAAFFPRKDLYDVKEDGVKIQIG